MSWQNECNQIHVLFLNYWEGTFSLLNVLLSFLFLCIYKAGHMRYINSAHHLHQGFQKLFWHVWRWRQQQQQQDKLQQTNTSLTLGPWLAMCGHMCLIRR